MLEQKVATFCNTEAGSALALFVALVFADDSEDSRTFYDAAVVAHSFD